MSLKFPLQNPSEPSVLVFPVNLNGSPTNEAKTSASLAGYVKYFGDFGGILKSLFILKNLASQKEEHQERWQFY